MNDCVMSKTKCARILATLQNLQSIYVCSQLFISLVKEIDTSSAITNRDFVVQELKIVRK